MRALNGASGFRAPATRSGKMLIQMCKAKIHRARISSSDLDYEGSLEVDLDLLEQSGIFPYEKILVVNASNGERLETYAIPGKRGSRVFRLNGAAARKGCAGDIITIMAFGLCDEKEAEGFSPKVLVMDADNKVAKVKQGRKTIE